MRRAAAEALGNIGDPPALPALLQALQDEDGGVRRAAAEALGNIGDPQALPALTQALQDKDGWVRRAAVKALKQLLPASLPQGEKERRAWQERLRAIRRAARRARAFDLLAAVLERQAAWAAALSPWQDPLQPPPVPAWQAWAQQAGRVALAPLIAGLATLVMMLLTLFSELLAEAVRAFVQRQPLWAVLLLIIILGAVGALLGWMGEALWKKR